MKKALFLTIGLLIIFISTACQAPPTEATNNDGIKIAHDKSADINMISVTNVLYASYKNIKQTMKSTKCNLNIDATVFVPSADALHTGTLKVDSLNKEKTAEVFFGDTHDLKKRETADGKPEWLIPNSKLPLGCSKIISFDGDYGFMYSDYVIDTKYNDVQTYKNGETAPNTAMSPKEAKDKAIDIIHELPDAKNRDYRVSSILPCTAANGSLGLYDMQCRMTIDNCSIIGDGVDIPIVATMITDDGVMNFSANGFLNSEKGSEISKIISLDSALEICRSKLGAELIVGNSATVKAIELCYIAKNDNGTIRYTPAWYFSFYNDVFSGSGFYINAQTGELTTI